MYVVQYPYLQEIYHNYDDEQERWERQRFLDSLDTFVNQRQYIKITLLSWDEKPLKEIQGKLVSGTLSKDGTSSVRRSCSFTATLSGGEYDIENMDMDFGINRKIYLEIGVKNDSRRYRQYPILWFPQGMFIIANFSMTSSTSTGVNISLQCKDKMCMLNGDIGGRFPATTILDMEDTQDPKGIYVQKKVLIYDIIREVVCHIGGELQENIVIENVDKVIRKIVQWIGANPLYLIRDDKGNYTPSLEKPTSGTYMEYKTGVDCGYMYEEFYYPQDLTMSAGQTICNALDAIKNLLGNYEYYYDVYGVFHFQEIKNYLNNTQQKVLVNDMDANNYLVDTVVGKDLYSFDSNRNLVSLTANPQYLNIKNDFIVHGLRKDALSSNGFPIRYHLAIDHKPTPSPHENILLYKEPESGLIKAAKAVEVLDENGKALKLPVPGNFNLIYCSNDGVDSCSFEDAKSFYYWDDEYKKVELIVKPKETDSRDAWTPKDWRTELYLQGVEARNTASDPGYYWPELESGWPAIYDLENEKFYGQDSEGNVTTQAYSGSFILDFIEPSGSEVGKFAVSAIGRRQFVNSNNDINCLFEPEIPQVVFIRASSDATSAERTWATLRGDPVCQVSQEIFNGLSLGGYRNSAYDAVKYDLTQHTTYQSTVSMTAVPAFYMEPNVRTTVSDSTTNTYGSFVITNINIPLAPGGNMSVTAREAFERY